jgi:hypothetical protein
MSKRKLFFLFWPVLLLLAPLLRAETLLPFISGEKLEYEMKWGFFPVGYATMEVNRLSVGDGNHSAMGSVNQVKFFVRTNSFADTFYKVRTTITSTMDDDFTRTLSYQKSQREGSTRREILVDYDYGKKEVRYHLNGEDPKTIPLPEPCFDPLAIAYYFRIHPIEPNSEKVLPTCDGKKFRQVIVRSGDREKLKLPMGTYSVIRTEPAMENLGGVFNKSPDGLLQVWYSDDQRRVPVRVSSKVVVGSFTATLIRAYPPLEKNF